jgi:anti-sigma factor RsiW
MQPDDRTLLAHVDGELPAAQRQALEAQLASQPDLAQTVALLQASRLPYQRAFDEQAVPPVPEALQQLAQAMAQGAQLAQQGAARQAAGSAALAGAGGGLARAPSGAPVRGRRLWLGALAVGAAGGWWLGQRRQGPTIEPWVRMVSSYHAMYARETVQDALDQGGAPAALLTRLSQQNGLTLQIPDLAAEGLHFVRAQQLQFEGRMVLQLVYLPAQGLPVALCLMPATQQAERALAIDGQRLRTWYAGGWAYLLVGQLPDAQMTRLRQRLDRPLV